MLSELIYFLLIYTSSVIVLAASETDFSATNCNCNKYEYSSTACYNMCKEEYSKTDLLIQVWEGSVEVMFWCEKESISKEWYNSLRGMKKNVGDTGMKVRVMLLSCPIPDVSIKEVLVEKAGLLNDTSEITRLHITEVKNFDPSSSANLFTNLTGLEEVHIDSTNLQHIPSNFFQPLSNTSSFTIITLNENKLSQLDVDAFKNLEFLEEIDLSKNNLNQLEDGTFSKLYKLQVLSLNGNSLNQLSTDIFKDLINLEHLYLNDNYLTNLTTKIFAPLRKLTKLNLDSNALMTLDADSFDNLGLMVDLNLGSNHISSTILPKLISNMSNLEEIILNKNGIRRLETDTFSKSQELRKVILKDNLLKELPDTLFQNCLKLEEINLGSNKLITLKEMQFQKLEELKNLYLHSNKLTSIPANTFKDLKKLSLLTLNDNRLTSLPDALFQNVGELVRSQTVEISLDNNPWECNCNAKYLLSVLKDSSKFFIDDKWEITCAKSDLEVDTLSLQQICNETQVTSG